MTLTFRWLGAAGIEFTYYDQILLVDPFLTRPSLAKVLLNRPLQPDEDLLKKHLPRAQWVLVSHPHYDHLMDVPAIQRLSSARVFGSPNTCSILQSFGVPDRQIEIIQTGDQIDPGPFHIEILPCWHTQTPIDSLINGKLSLNLHPPLRPLEYKMDVDFSFLIQAGDYRLMVGNEPVGAHDFLFTTPFCPTKRLAEIIRRGRPRVIFPIHWDNFFLPLSHTPAPLPIRSASWQRFQHRVHAISPQIEVKVLNVFATYACDAY